jgi:hypothetical protein
LRRRVLATLRRRWLESLTCLGLAIASPAHAQVLLITPSCGVAGTSVAISGSGWAEPNPVCRYVFSFDGASLAPDQPDGLFGPPSTTGTVPAGAAVGKHVIQTQLRLNNPDSLLQCRQRNFKVVAMVADPWNAGANITPNYGGHGALTSIFDPTNACMVTDCTQIVPIQTIQQTGMKADGTTRNLTFAEQNFGNAANLQKDVTPAGWTIDYVGSPGDPFYMYPAPGQMRNGVQGDMPVASSHGDMPQRSSVGFPADITTIILNFEVNYFCAEGENRGEYLGQFFWTWTKTSASTATDPYGTVTNTAPTQGTAPTGNFSAALSLWANNHGFAIPIGVPHNQTGDPCS